MATKIFVNLPVKNLERSIKFFTEMGYRFNPQFTDEKATCMIISDDIYVMLLMEEFFKTFTSKQVADSGKTTEVILSLSADNRAQVDELVQKAFAAGATRHNEPQDYGWMYQHGFQDPDGHLWEVFYLDEKAMPVQAAAPQTNVVSEQALA